MEIYRITKDRFANLSSPGYAARWNSKGVYVIYAAQSRSLAVLENIAHRPSVSILDKYVTMVIDVPEDIEVGKIDPESLQEGWNLLDEKAKGICQVVGDQFVSDHKFTVLKVPSVIVPQEFNYLINTDHPDFVKIQIKKIEPFLFDSRILNMS
ncbi:MAG: RES family NAD+ phosphorylase [Mangrovibacterium sp.]|nr:RES family NAD+ phosphorylase [Mangrovibacterium sp.]